MSRDPNPTQLLAALDLAPERCGQPDPWPPDWVVRSPDELHTAAGMRRAADGARSRG